MVRDVEGLATSPGPRRRAGDPPSPVPDSRSSGPRADRGECDEASAASSLPDISGITSSVSTRSTAQDQPGAP